MIKAKEESGESEIEGSMPKRHSRGKNGKETLRVKDRQVSQRLANYSGGREEGKTRKIRDKKKETKRSAEYTIGMGKISPIVAGRDKTRIARATTRTRY